MKTMLLVSATAFEIAPLVQKFGSEKISDGLYRCGPHHQVKTCVTGVGMTHTALALGQLHDQVFDVALNIGVAGGFGEYGMGQLVNVARDCFSELGAEDGDQFLSIETLGLGESVFTALKPYNSHLLNNLPKVNGITVNTVHGQVDSIEKIIARWQPDVETMEGAAFICAANQFHWPCAQIRAISNKVERRNRSNWQIEPAITLLNDFTFKLIQEWINLSN